MTDDSKPGMFKIGWFRGDVPKHNVSLEDALAWAQTLHRENLLKIPAVANMVDEARTKALARGDVLAALEEVYTSGAMGGEWPTLGADAVMELLERQP